jgi:hypothetical protein
MSIFGTSGKRDRVTAMANAMQAQQAQQAIDSRLNAGQMWGTQAIDAAQPLQLGALQEGRTQGLDALSSGYDQQRADYQTAADSYAPYTSQGLDAWSMLGDAAGLHGQEGHDRALGAFHAGPQYDWLQSQSADQAVRGASVGGQALSGNAIRAIQDNASHIADGAWDKSVANIRDISNTGYDANNKVAAITTGMGDAASRYGSGVANLWGTSANQLADVYGNDARAKAGIYGQTATAGANALGATRDRIIDANNEAMKGGDTAEANQNSLWRDLLGAGTKLAAAKLSPAPSIFGKS